MKKVQNKKTVSFNLTAEIEHDIVTLAGKAYVSKSKLTRTALFIGLRELKKLNKKQLKEATLE